MGRTIRVGLIGCGFYARNHLHSWKDLAPKGAVLAGVCDIDPQKAEAAGREFGAPSYTNAEAMIVDTGVDVVDIATQQGAHRTLAELAARRGVAAIVQKPFAPSWEDCVAIVEAAERAGTWLAVHENFRYQAPMRRVRAVIDSGAIGMPTWARIIFRTGYDIYQGQPYLLNETRFAIADVGIHVLDLARYFLGEVAHLSCETQRRNPRAAGEDTGTMMLRHESGAVSLVECSYGSRREPDPFPETLLEIEGDRGSIVVTTGCNMTLTTSEGARAENIGTPLLPWTSHPWHVSQEGALGACAHFLDCLQRGVPAETSGVDNLRTYALVDAAYRAAETGAAARPLRWESRAS